MNGGGGGWRGKRCDPGKIGYELIVMVLFLSCCCCSSNSLVSALVMIM
jgi:hypothetical protein